MSRLVLSATLVLLCQPLLGQSLSSIRSSSGGRAVIAFASDETSANPGSAASIPGPVPYAESIAPPSNYFGPAVKGHDAWRLPSMLYASANFIHMDRDNDSHHRALVIDANNGNTMLSTRDLDFDFESGLRATIGLRRPCCSLCSAWEFSYMGVSDWDDSATVIGNDNLSVAGDLGFVVNGFTLAESVRASYSSKVHSGEANCFKCIYNDCWGSHFRRVDWLWGVRYLKLDEEFTLLGDNQNVAAAIYNVDTDNNLYGAQIGGRIRNFHGRWGWEVTKKAGVFANDLSQRQQIIDELGVNDVLIRSASASGDDVAFLADLNVSAIYQVSRLCGLRFGYNLLWLTGVALAPNQLDFSDRIDSGQLVEDGDGALLHGFNVGLEVNW